MNNGKNNWEFSQGGYVHTYVVVQIFRLVWIFLNWLKFFKLVWNFQTGLKFLNTPLILIHLYLCRHNTFKDLELCVGDFTLDLAELYEVLISNILLLSSLSHAVEYWDDSDAPVPKIPDLWCSPCLTVDLRVRPEGSFQFKPCRTLWPLKAAWIVVAALVLLSWLQPKKI